MIKTEQEFIEKVSKFPFRFAKTYAKSAPHEYFICDYSDPICCFMPSGGVVNGWAKEDVSALSELAPADCAPKHKA